MTVERTLHGWGFGGEDVGHAQVIMSELITNAIAHANVRDVRYRIERDGFRVLLAVWDTSPEDPEIKTFDLEAESGRGLLIIETLADKWGVEREEYGKYGKWVWAAIQCRAAECILPSRRPDE
jgi:anti-sigma regulatory factor (Ser/Thr protein kinase)